MRKLFVALLLAAPCVSVQAESDLKSLTNISEELVRIRQQIETLHNDINYQKDTFKEQMRSYASQRSDLDVRISRAELNTKELQRDLEKLTAIKDENSKGYEKIAPVLKEAITHLRDKVAQSLPFKRFQRLAALNEIESRLDTHIITPNKAANQLWAFVEDELMMGNSSGLYNDTLQIDGKDKLVKVLRIGKVALFYQTRDGHYGVIRNTAGKWESRPVTDAERTAELQKVFDAFNKNIHSGQFTIPNFLPKI